MERLQRCFDARSLELPWELKECAMDKNGHGTRIAGIVGGHRPTLAMGKTEGVLVTEIGWAKKWSQCFMTDFRYLASKMSKRLVD